jgi:hypothetical protein
MKMCALLALAFTVPVYATVAQNTRTFVSTLGSDLNDCLVAAPCRTFSAALAVTAPNGEIVVLTSGGYAAAAISQPVTISAVGVTASIITTGTGLNINTSGSVTIIGLAIHGQFNPATGNGIAVANVGYLRLYDVTIDGFEFNGLVFNATGNLAIYDSRINDNGADGVAVHSGVAYIHNTSFENNGTAAVSVSSSANVTVADSHIDKNTTGFVNAGALVLVRDQIVSNTTGVTNGGSGSVNLTYCVLAQNTTALTGTADLGTNPATNLIIGGSLTSTPALQ